MTRSRKSARQAGSRFNRVIADYLAQVLDDDRIDRRVLTGSNDKGDVAALRHPVSGAKIVVECKDYAGEVKVGPWLKEAETERLNDAAHIGVVMAKRRGVTNPGQQIVLMTVSDFVAVLLGHRVEIPIEES